MMKKVLYAAARIAALVLIVAVLWVYFSGWHHIFFVPGPERAFGDEAKACAGRLALSDPGKLPVLVLEGTPEEMGRQHGEVLGTKLRELLRPFLERQDGKSLPDARRAARESLEPHIPAEYVAEMKALAEAAKVDYEDVLVANCSADLCWAFLCSAVVATGEAVKPGTPLVFGRNLDYPGYGIVDGYSMVAVFRPKGKLAFAAATFPGLVGVVSGLNEKGVAIADLVDLASGKPTKKGGLPHLFRQRAVLEKATTVDEALGIARALPAAVSHLHVVADEKSAAILEIAPTTSSYRRPDAKGLLMTANDFTCAAEKAADGSSAEDPGRPTSRHGCLRRLAEAAHGRIDAEAVREMLTATSLDHINLQAMVFVPAERALYLARGETLARASDQAYVRIELGPAFAAGAAPQAAKVSVVGEVPDEKRPKRFDED